MRGDTVPAMLRDLAKRELQADIRRFAAGAVTGLGSATALVGLLAQSAGSLVAGSLLGGAGAAVYLISRSQAEQARKLSGELSETAALVNERLVTQEEGRIINRRFIETPAFRNPTQVLDAKTGWEISRSVELDGLRAEQKGGLVTLDDGHHQTSFPGELQLARPNHPKVSMVHELATPIRNLDRVELTIRADGSKSLGLVGEAEWDEEGIAWVPGLVYRHEQSPASRGLWQPTGMDEISLDSSVGRVSLPSPVRLTSLARVAPLEVSQVENPMQPRVAP